jgi:Domain of unknown function (DUF1906)
MLMARHPLLPRALRYAAIAALAACSSDHAVGPTDGGGNRPGFDASLYPGDAAMRAWKQPGSPYTWAGYYLPAPCHRDGSWTGHRATLATDGWGMAVLYVGQQAWDALRTRSTPDGRIDALPDAHSAASRAAAAPATSASTLAVTCSQSLLTAQQGATEADDAVARTAAEGFPRGTVIFLDIEGMTTVPSTMHAYYRAWVARVLADGRFRPGIYTHRANADAIRSGVVGEYAAAGRGGDAAYWITGGTGFDLDRAPADVGLAYAAVWQGRLDVARTWNGVTLTVDENVATGGF